jgi:uncharacterized protein
MPQSHPERKTHPAKPRLDPRQPLVLDTRELGRRPGAMRRVQRTGPAPAELGQAMAVVTPGSPLVLDLRLESVMEGVLVSGTVSATMSGECGRCLDPVRSELTVDIQELFRYPDSGPHAGRAAARAEAEPADDDELPSLVDDLIDLEPVLRDALVLELPMSPLCQPDCRGLCPGCGERLDDLPEDHSHDAVDPRWAALSGLRAGAGPAEASPEQES